MVQAAGVSLGGDDYNNRNYPAYIGLDVHKGTIAWALAIEGRSQAEYGSEIPNRRKNIVKLVVINCIRVAISTMARMQEEVMTLPVILQVLIAATHFSLLVGCVAGVVGIIVGGIAVASPGLAMSLLLVDLAMELSAYHSIFNSIKYQ